MKKIIALFTSLMVLFSGLLVKENKTEIETNKYAENTITTYLVLGENGLYNGEKGQDYPELFLENAVAFEATVGATLPDKTVVTSTLDDVEFSNWMVYEGLGFPTKKDVVGVVNGQILYASYVFTGELGGDIEPPTPASGWYIVGEGSFISGTKTWDVSTGIALTVNENYTGDGTEYMGLGISFEAGDIFKLTNGTDWISGGWESSYGAFASGNISLVSDGFGGNNVGVNNNCKLDIYFKVYTNGGYSCYIGDSSN
ncbi:MAG: hypothetical protein ACI31G_02150 [Bacilli bacterium]